MIFFTEKVAFFSKSCVLNNLLGPKTVLLQILRQW